MLENLKISRKFEKKIKGYPDRIPKLTKCYFSFYSKNIVFIMKNQITEIHVTIKGVVMVFNRASVIREEQG